MATGARYQQVAETLLGQLADGSYRTGESLPTELQLCELHGVSRGTLRRALERLEQLGMISRRPRAGTVVIATRPAAPYQPAAQSPADVAVLAADTRLLKPAMGPIELDAARAQRLGADPGTTWFLIEGLRVRRSDPKVPLCWSEHYAHGGPTEHLLKGTVVLEDLTRLRVEQTISASLLDPRMAAALDAEPGGPALVVMRRHYDAAGELGAVGIHTHPGDRYRITTTL